MATSEARLSVEDVHTYYGDSYVLQGCSLSVPRGRIVALLGRNGMGKTTLIRTVAGLTPPRSGRVLLDGAPITGLSPHTIAQRGIGLVPQGRRTFPSLTVRENLLVPTSRLARRRPHGDGGAGPWTLDRVLHEFPGLAERVGHRARHLSGGEQQMLAIGRALMHNPTLILMDEPSEGLAPVLVTQLGEMLRRLRRDGHSILLVEQNVDLALAVSDYVYVLTSGRVVYEDTAAAVARNPEVIGQHLGI